MKTMSKYWTKRDIKQRQKLLSKTINETDKELALQYRKVAERLKIKLQNTYREILESKKDETILVSDLYRYNKYYETLADINNELNKLNESSVKILGKQLPLMYRENTKLLNKQMGLYSKADKYAVNVAVNSIWCADGKNWSTRIWTNKALLANKLETTLVDAVASGVSIDTLTKNIMADFGVSFSNAQRLVRTELAHVQNVSTADRYKDAGVSKYTIIAEDDACDECLELAEQEFDINNIVIPAHPNCRCCMIPVVED